jgi:hypothetical protein
MRFDPTGMTQAEIDSLSEAYNQMVMGAISLQSLKPPTTLLMLESRSRLSPSLCRHKTAQGL